MRPAPAWIAWAALAAAAAGCCRMQPPSAVDSLESTWTRLRDRPPASRGHDKRPSPSGAPSGSPARPVPAVSDSPSRPVPAPAAADTLPDGSPVRPAASGDSPGSRPSVPIEVPPAAGESPGSKDSLPLSSLTPSGRVTPVAGVASLPVPSSSPGVTSAGAASPLAVGPAASVPRGASAAPFGVAPPTGARSDSLADGLRLGSPASGVAPVQADARSLPVPESADAESERWVRRESFLPPLRNLMVPGSLDSRPLAVSPASAPVASQSSPAASPRLPAAAGRALPASVALPEVPVPPALSAATVPPTSPGVGREPDLLARRTGRDPAAAVPAAALDRASAGDPETEAARRRRDEAAFLEREAEAGVLRQFLRRVLRLDPPPASAPPAAPVSEPGR